MGKTLHSYHRHIFFFNLGEFEKNQQTLVIDKDQLFWHRTKMWKQERKVHRLWWNGVEKTKRNEIKSKSMYEEGGDCRYQLSLGRQNHNWSASRIIERFKKRDLSRLWRILSVIINSIQFSPSSWWSSLGVAKWDEMADFVHRLQSLNQQFESICVSRFTYMIQHFFRMASRETETDTGFCQVSGWKADSHYRTTSFQHFTIDGTREEDWTCQTTHTLQPKPASYAILAGMKIITGTTGELSLP